MFFRGTGLSGQSLKRRGWAGGGRDRAWKKGEPESMREEGGVGEKERASERERERESRRGWMVGCYILTNQYPTSTQPFVAGFFPLWILKFYHLQLSLSADNSCTSPEAEAAPWHADCNQPAQFLEVGSRGGLL